MYLIPNNTTQPAHPIGHDGKPLCHNSIKRANCTLAETPGDRKICGSCTARLPGGGAAFGRAVISENAVMLSGGNEKLVEI